ncbi:hypothetical protein D082_06450 [Synechocystis sp. PCC 6714]|nr:hypothetical protein D082_06450 [Synechocystis sp. PCC 6714]
MTVFDGGEGQNAGDRRTKDKINCLNLPNISGNRAANPKKIR